MKISPDETRTAADQPLYAPGRKLSARSEVEAKADETLPLSFLKSSSTVRSACEYEPGPTCAAYSSSIDFLKRSSLFLNIESPPPIFSCAIAGSYSPAPGVCCLGRYAPRFVCEANAEPCFASGASGSLASYVPGPGASLGTESSARLTLVPKPPAPVCCDLLNDLDVAAASVVLSYGLYAPGSPTSLSDTSFLRSDLDLKAAEPASASTSVPASLAS